MPNIAAQRIQPLSQTMGNWAAVKGQRIQNQQASQNIATQKRNMEASEAKAYIESEQKKAEVAHGKLDFANRLLSTVTDEKTLKHAKEQYLSVFPDDAPNVDRFMPQGYDKGMIDQARKQIIALQKQVKPFILKEGDAVVDPITNAKITERTKTQEGYGEPYIDESTGSLMQKNTTTGQVKKIAAPPSGMVIEADGKGGFTMRTGVKGGGMTVKTKGEVEAKLLGSQESIARLEAIRNEFKPEYQEIGSRLSNEWTGLKAKAGVGVSKEDSKKLTEYKRFQRRSIENINLYIKEITGAQMSEKEADRLRLAQPDPGEKWYSGDDPVTFKAKLDDVINTGLAVKTRYENYRAQGLSDLDIKRLLKSGKIEPLKNFMPTKKTIDQRGDELASRGMNDKEVMNVLKREGYF